MKMATTKKATKATETKKETPRTVSLQSRVTTFIKAKGEKGTDAVAIAAHLELIDSKQKLDDMDANQKADRAKALKKVRVLARKATGGASQSRDGRSAIYVIK
tara:strand:- start:336 stop:644 length:309 start_codon:yes stop_codon:yes gene_type:complete